jgi:hypothetical protein
MVVSSLAEDLEKEFLDVGISVVGKVAKVRSRDQL